MIPDAKRELFRHLTAGLAFRAKIAISGAPSEFADFKIGENVRTPVEILAHLGDLLEGSLFLMQGEFVLLNSAPLTWEKEIGRFFSAVKRFDSFLASDAPLNQPIEKIVQGPIADALTHIGQIIMLRRAAGFPAEPGNYFAAEIIAGEINFEENED